MTNKPNRIVYQDDQVAHLERILKECCNTAGSLIREKGISRHVQVLIKNIE